MEEENNFTNKEETGTNYGLLGGKAMTNIVPGEEIVISGMSGTFPNSDNVLEFKENLFNKVNMVLPNRRWDIIHPEIPTCSGTIPNLEKYDPGFFGVHERQSQSLDPMIAQLHEKTIEAIFDAGLHPSDLQNTRTGVFVGVCFSENDKTWFFDNRGPETYAMTGSERSMAAHRLSYLLKIKGPSYTCDTACSSSLYAFEQAFRALRLGEIDNAIVAGTNMCCHPFVSLQFARLGVLSKNGSCKAFDAQGDGYARSEAVGVLLLQRAKDAKRIYCEVIYIKTNCDGYKEQGITFPSKNAQRDLLNDFYDECGVDRYSLSFLEAHGTGTFVGDPEECSAIDDVFTKKRTKQLLIGSVKSNIGHSEPASGVCSIIKCIIGMESGFIPPNIHYNKPRSEIKGLVEGRMEVVTEKTPFKDDLGLIGINSFGFGGGNCHLLLRWHPKTKVKFSTPKDELPRLVCVSGRTEQAVITLLDSVLCNNVLDAGYVKLLHTGFRKNVENHMYRGYTLTSNLGETARSIKFVKEFPKSPRPFYFAFEELNNWYNVGCDLMSLPMFSTSIQRIQKVLVSKQVNIFDILLKKSPNKDVGDLLGSVVVQIGVIDVLNLLEIKATDKLECSFGELLSAYYEELLSLEETIDYAFSINKALNNINEIVENNNNNKQEIKAINGDYIPNGNTTNDNQVSNVIQIGSETTLKHLRTFLKNKNLTTIKDDLLVRVLKDLKSSKGSKDKKWLKHVISAIFNVFQNIDTLSPDSIILKMGDGPSYELEEDQIISPFCQGAKNYLVEFFKGIGSLYELGYNPQVSKLYPSVQFPVSRGTQMVSPFIKWNHRKTKCIPEYNIEVASQATHGGRSIKIQMDDHKWRYIKGHVIDGRNLFPAMGYLYVVWETFSIMNNVPISVMQVCFENCKFIRATTLPKKGHITLYVNINKGSGNFEVVEGDAPVVTGKISLLGTKADTEDLRQYHYSFVTQSSNLKLKTKDVYKELRLRGYSYKGDFRAIEDYDISTSNAHIKWNDNWVTFMDNMLQLKILKYDSRLLYVPTYISKLTILAKVHLEMVNTELMKGQKSPILPVLNDMETGTIRCGGINIWGLIATSIPKRKILGIPVLETYKFVPNFTVLDLHQSIRVNTQIILENALLYKVKAVELIDEFTRKDIVPLSPIIKSALEDQPLIQPFLKILSKTPMEDIDIEVEDKKLTSETDCLLVIASNILNRPDVLKEACAVLTESGFILTRESHKFDTSKDVGPDISVFTVHRTVDETLFLLRKLSKTKKSKHVNVNSLGNFSWLPEVQNSVIKEKNEDIVLYVENEPTSGILGLTNCLRREPPSKNVRCVFMVDEGEPFSLQSSFHLSQLKKQMAINVYKEGQWGTYRHLLLDNQSIVESEHCFVNIMTRGDLTSLKWIEGPLRHDMKDKPEQKLVHVYYCALNFRDVMTTTGKITVDVVTQNRLAQECIQGFEFSGRDKKGNRIMGMIPYGALSSLILDDLYMMFPIPDSWSFEEAATVPVVYGTVIYALIIRGQIMKGDSILIHSGTGGIGQAAIRIALYYGCKVFTTVGTKEKRDFLKKTFPQLKDHHIGNSHDESFEQWISVETNGRGVDLVLNSLAEEKLVASIRCLTKGGRFIEIGKFDMANNHHLNMLLFEKELSFQGVMLDLLFNSPPYVQQKALETFRECLRYGAIKPLNRTVFKCDEVEQAFRFMATGKHMGKVLIQLRKPENELVKRPSVTKFSGLARYFCDPDKVYIVAGGLGGFGLELTDWLILRGAKRVVLTSRKGVSTGYQNYRINIWKSYGVLIKISTAPITTRKGCRELLEESFELGRIDAIFNLAVVLADGLFENQTVENFDTSFGPKANATNYLDELTRKLCPDLSEFVVFSSVSCGRGNAGQTNYGMSNSVMERICEARRAAGYPALAIEWGAVGEVGLVAEMLEDDTEIEISGTLQQRISNCLQVLDVLLRQKDAAIVSSIVVAEKRGINSADNIVDAVINILGLNDSKSVSLHSTLAELGMDSITAVEIKQVLERDFEVFLTAKDIRTMTLAKLREMQNEKLGEQDGNENVAHFGIEMVIRTIGNEMQSSLPYVEMISKISRDSEAPTVFLFPGIDGVIDVYQDLTKELNAHAIGVQLNLDDNQSTIKEMAESVMTTLDKCLCSNEFILVAYSFGAIVALEVVSILESRGYHATIIIIDGSPLLQKQMLLNLEIETDRIFETAVLCHLLSFYMTIEEVGKHKEKIFKCDTWDDRVDLGIEIIKHNTTHEANYQRLVANRIYTRAKALMTYTPSYTKLKSRVKLLKPSQAIVTGLPEDYGLSEYFETPIEVLTVNGNHVTILENEIVAATINECLPPITDAA
ncbi:fatty acid synthase-like [Anoplophora glabripennis]|uniref:fatty acid synthase-like n=1 Tax=Anoplophora glabripennis TaxID=217634 RepID=UPI0008749A2A|nr:fatty acid synthase-like [Anoplophora glabripennis]